MFAGARRGGGEMAGEIVTAVPGSGKTHTLIEKCYSLMVDEGVENVVAITFTDRAASELMDRLKSRARRENNLELLKKLPESNVGTIHNFCSKIIRDYGEIVKIRRDFKVMDEMESFYFLDRVIREFLIYLQDSDNDNEVTRTLDFIIDYFNTDIEDVIKSIRDILEDHRSYFIKMHLLNGAFSTVFRKGDFSNEIIREILSKFSVSMIPYLTIIISAVVNEYQESKKEEGQMDFDDLLVYTYEISRKMGKELAERYPYILIDEFQDTDEMQISIFDNFLSNGSFIFAVGDPHQSIYSFRGAHPDAQEKLQEKIDSRMQLKENRRSFSSLIKFYNSIFPKIMGSEEMMPFQRDEGNVDISIEDDPFFAISEIIKDNIRKGVKPGEIAVLSRTGTQFLKLKKLLKDEGIDAVTVSGESILKSQEGLDIYNIIRYLADPSDKVAQAGLLLSPIFNFDVSGMYSERDSLSRIVSERMMRYREMLRKKRLDHVIENILLDEGYLSSISKSEDRNERNDRLWRIMVVLSSHLERYGDDILSVRKWYENAMQTKESGPIDDLLTDDSRVKIMTIHQSKGLEFRVVIVYGLDSGRDNERYYADDSTGIISKNNYGFIISPSKKILEKGTLRKHSREEELRVMYVAFTRAKEQLHIIISREEFKGKIKCKNSESSLCALQRVLDLWEEDDDETIAKKLSDVHINFKINTKTPPIVNTCNNSEVITISRKKVNNAIFIDEDLNTRAIKEFLSSKNDSIKNFRVIEEGNLLTISNGGLKIYERRRVPGSYYIENGKIEYII